jgi:glycosyltransferase involved in cell wall biosynthesis
VGFDVGHRAAQYPAVTPEPHPSQVVRATAGEVAVIVAARNEADRIAETIAALGRALPGAAVWVADDASEDGTAEAALSAGARLVRRGRRHGKGGNMTAAAQAVLGDGGAPEIVLLCDGDLGGSAEQLAKLAEAVRSEATDLAIASFSARVGGGFGITVGFARRAIRRRCGFDASAPISGQRAMRADVLRAVLPFAPGFGMETAMTIDAVRAGYLVSEIELDLEHRATGRTLGGFAHRGHQLLDIARASRARRQNV